MRSIIQIPCLKDAGALRWTVPHNPPAAPGAVEVETKISARNAITGRRAHCCVSAYEVRFALKSLSPNGRSKGGIPLPAEPFARLPSN